MNLGAKSLTTVLTTFTLLSGCSEGTPDNELHAEATLPLTSVCNDAVGPFSIDGIPAYAQCEASTNAAIYSNNGVDTATSAVSSDWKRTQFSGGYQCTELVHRYWLFKWNVTFIPNGDAWRWCETTPPSNSGLTLTTTPVHGDAIVFAQGACGSSATYGHVALVDTVDSAGSKVTIVEQNNVGRRATAISCASCFLHVVANTGTEGIGGASGTGGATNVSSGTSSVGGTKATGGTSSVGGTQTSGGTSSVGGTQTSGGTSSVGDTQTSGGTSSVGGNSDSNSTVPNTTTPAGGSSSTLTPLGGSVGTNTSTLVSAGQSTVVEGEPDETDAGCACTTSGNQSRGAPTWWFLVLGTLLLRKRRSTHARR
jgi:MYXO-CTERM domain-containing protein